VTLVTYGLAGRGAPSGASLDVQANRIEAETDGTGLVVHGLPGGPAPCRIPLYGRFNVANVLAALACVVALGADPGR
jgi:UDP-N-acetylmuramyl tripeptide synthase